MRDTDFKFKREERCERKKNKGETERERNEKEEGKRVRSCG